MKLNELRPAKGAKKKRKRVGCGTGSGHGGTSTRGHKGHKARSGGGSASWFEGGQMPLQRRVPKHGFTNIFRKEYQVVNVGALTRFDAGSVVDPESLREAGVLKRQHPVKLLGNGTLDRALVVKVHAASEAAKAKVEASGGSVEILSQQKSEGGKNA
ncbi:MAG: 50S ribosomal protein L15 [Candidatus Eisenbacteria bacterium]|nr:50S ribosomal protein L15 [Candidatus Eisenbacteria bacterium]